MAPLPKVSAIILIGGKYDKKLLEKCLDSVSWADEIVKVETTGLKGSFADWRNLGAKKAKNEWLCYVDSDETVTPKLKEMILQVIASSEFSAYAIPRRNIFLGHTMRWGGWWPDFVVRLIKKDKLKGWNGELHEQPKIDGTICHLKEPLIHESHRSLSEMVEKTNKWSEIEAKLLYNSGHPKMNIFRFLSAGFREFWYRGIIKLGFLDGTVGVIEIIYQTFSRLITYSKLWELQLKYQK
ncbi:MAG: glycosyltransferase family 2 protein [Candidatus Woesebacteria bacterium]|nr:glycosyltransferase family 2 protein [Candidatus Woesebacteria bacterium]